MTLQRFAVLLLIGVAAGGCLKLKPVSDSTRFYVLSAVPGRPPGVVDVKTNLAIGLARVEIPAYLLDHRIALRRGGNEIFYSGYQRWAEGLEEGIQRVLGANLSTLLGSDRVMLSVWRRGEADAEIHLAMQRFECDEEGRIVLEAMWEVSTPSETRKLHAGHSRITRSGPKLLADAQGAVGALSQALGDLSREIAAAVQQTMATSSSPRSTTE